MNTRAKLHVLVATPLGQGGQGGIDRMTDAFVAELHRWAGDRLSVKVARTRGEAHILFSWTHLLAFIWIMVTLRIRGQCDLLHINVAAKGSTFRKALIASIARLLGVPYVVHLHGSGYDEFWTNLGPWARTIAGPLFAHASRVIVLGRTWQKFVQTQGLCAAQKIIVLPNATQAKASPLRNPCPSSVRILFLGKLGQRKGAHILLEALHRLRDVGEWQAVLAGNGDVTSFRQTVQKMSLDKWVSIKDWQTASATQSLLLQSDILVLPSFAENLPMSVIEAMAAGLAIVATPVGAVPDIIEDGKSGILIGTGDVSALSNALSTLIRDRNLRDRLGTAARAFHREHLNLARYSQRLLTVWQDCSGSQN